MRMTFVISSLTCGGAERFLIRLVNYLVRKKDQKISLFNLNLVPCCVTANRLVTQLLMMSRHIAPNTQNLEKRLDKNITYVKVPFFRSHGLRESLLPLLLERHIRKFKSDIVNSHLYHADKIVARSHIKVPFIITEHGDYNIPQLEFKKEILQQADYVICVSEFSKSYISEIGDFNAKKIYCGYQRGKVKEIIKRSEIGISEDSFVFCMVARGIPEKGWIEAVNAFRKFKYYNSSFLIAIGSGPGIDEAISFSKKEGIKNIRFVGFQEQPQKFMKISDASLLPSYSESFGISLVEGLNENLPIVASNVGGIPEIVKDERGDVGVLCELNSERKPDIESLVSCMNEIYENKSYYQRNISYCIEKFSMQRCANEYIDLFEDVLRTED